MSITVIASTSKQGIAAATPNTTSAINTTGATIIEVSLAVNNGTTPTVSDSKSNTWVALTAIAGTNETTYKFYANCSASGKNGTSHTFSVSGANAFCPIAVVAYAGTNLIFGSQSAGAASGSTTALSTGSVTPPTSPALITSALGGAAARVGLAVAGGTLAIRETQVFSGGVSYALAIADEIQVVAAARNPAWSWTPASESAGLTAYYYEDVWPVPIEQARSAQLGFGTSGVLAFRRSVTAGNTIAVFWTTNATVTSTISDNQGNTYTQQAFIGNPTIAGGVTLWTATAGSSGALTVTVGVSGPGTGLSIGLVEIQTGYTYTTVQTATANNTGPAATANITTAGTGVVVGFMGERNGGAAYTDPSGWTLIGESSTAGINQPYSCAYITGAAGVYSPSWSFAGGTHAWAVVAASFEGPPTVGGVNNLQRSWRGIGRGVLGGAR